MMRNNERQFIDCAGTNDKIQDFDAVSLYVSAMFRSFVPTGVPKVMQIDEDCVVDKHTDLTIYGKAFFVKALVKEIGKLHAFPLQSKKIAGTGVRTYTNDLVGDVLYLDSVALEDFLLYQDAKVQLLCGYYFEDISLKMQEIINIIFQL